ISRSSPRFTSGRNRIPRTSVKIAAFAPMPSASVRMTVIDSPFALHSERTATFKSLKNSSGRKLMMYLQTSVNRVLEAATLLSDGAAPLFTFRNRAAKVLDGTNLPRAHFDPTMVGYHRNGLIEMQAGLIGKRLTLREIFWSGSVFLASCEMLVS